MERTLTIVSSLVVLGLLALVWQLPTNDVALSQAVKPSTQALSQTLLGVDELMQNVDQHTNEPLLVEGVVSTVSAENKTLGLIDTQEYAQCKIVTCSQLTLPVRWTGTMPHALETVRVKGAIQKKGSKFIFVADAVEQQTDTGEEG